MANLTVGTLPRITAPALADRLLKASSSSATASTDDAAKTKPSLQVVDVRDDDHLGGHIRGSKHVPSATLDYATPELVRTLADRDTVVFHCMLSQQRGPSAALKYARERERLLGADKGKCLLDGEDGGKGGQRVMVLEKGFGGWQQQ